MFQAVFNNSSRKNITDICSRFYKALYISLHDKFLCLFLFFSELVVSTISDEEILDITCYSKLSSHSFRFYYVLDKREMIF